MRDHCRMTAKVRQKGCTFWYRLVAAKVRRSMLERVSKVARNDPESGSQSVVKLSCETRTFANKFCDRLTALRAYDRSWLKLPLRVVSEVRGRLCAGFRYRPGGVLRRSPGRS